MIKIEKLNPFGRMCVSLGMLPSSYKESLTYEEQLLWFFKYLDETVIPTVNNNADAVEELQALYLQIKTYVDEYFDNLDVQEEINNKLDDMAESGQLTDIIAQYLQLAGLLIYNTVADMKSAENLVDGSTCKTLGYYSINDGGGATYKVREVINTDTVDEKFKIALSDNNLIAELIIENDTINFKQLGARSYDSNHNKIDSKSYIDAYLSYIDTKDSTVKLFIPAGVFFFSETILDKDHVRIEGVPQFSLYKMKGTVIAPLTNNQEYIWLIGSKTKNVNDIYYKNLYFTGYNIIYDAERYYKTNIEDIYNCDSLVKIYRVFGGFTDNLVFMFFKGQALEISSSFEIYYKLLNFRHGQNINGCILNFANTVNSTGVSASNFEKIMFEAMHGNLINVEASANFAHNYIGVINFEDYAYIYGDSDTGVYSTINGSYNDGTAIHHNVINLEELAQFDCDINSIELNNFSYHYYTLNNQQYIYDTIIKCVYSQYIDLNVNNINVAGILKNARVIKHSGENFGLLSGFIFNNIQTDSKDYICYFDVTGLSNIVINNNINKIQNTPKLIYNPFIEYRTNVLQLINSKNRGNVSYQSDSLNKNKLCVSLVNPTSYAVNRMEIKIPVTGSKLHLRAKSSNSNQFTLVADVKNGSTLVAHKYFTSTGADTFTWYSIDFSDVADFTSGEKGNYILEFYPSDSTNCNTILDSFFWD